MPKEYPLAVSISRQLGSGGSVIGRNLAKQLNCLLLDREIVHEAADKLGICVEELDSYEEKLKSVWIQLLYYFQYSDTNYNSTPVMIPSDRKIYEVEAEIISNTAKEKPVVVIGRSAGYILKDHPRHINIFLHADIKFRQMRVQEIFNVSANKALSLILETDMSRKEHISKFTGQNMCDAGNYDLTIDTSLIGIEKAEKLIVDYIGLRFGENIFEKGI